MTTIRLAHGLVLLLAALLGPNPVAFATVYVAVQNENYITVAMDTRIDMNRYFWTDRYDNQCKILPLGDRHIFFMTGTAFKGNYNAYQLAADDYRREPSPVNIKSLLNHWLRDVVHSVKENMNVADNIIDSIGTRDIVDGYFAGTNNDNRLSLYTGIVIRNDPHSSDLEMHTAEMNIKSYIGGTPRIDIENEILGMKTQRARDLLTKMTAQYSGSEPDKLSLERPN